MKKRIITLILCGVLAMSMSTPVFACEDNHSGQYQEQQQPQPEEQPQQQQPQEQTPTTEETNAYLYTHVVDSVDGELNDKGWYTIGQVSSSDAAPATGDTDYVTSGTEWDAFMSEIDSGDVDRYAPNENIDITKIDWTYYGLKGVSTGATDYIQSGNTWHIDGMYTNHRYVSSVTKQPTCTEEGEKTYICSDCGDSYSEALPATGHDWNAGEITKAATCTEDGVKTYTCNNDSSHTYTEVIPATGHSWETITMDPTCTDSGYTEQVCVACGEVKDVVILPALGHDWDNGTVTTEATCESDGIITYTCKRDVSHQYTEAIPATGHTWTETVVSPTCTEKGSITKTCSKCNKAEVTETDALGHDYDEGKITKQATCTEDGVITYTCKRDASHVYTETISAIGHKWTTDSKKATCTEKGYTKTYCTKCGEVKEYKEIPATGHDWDNGKVTTEPTCTTKGVKTYTCKNDASHTYTEEIPAIGHDMGDWKTTKDPTYDETGVAERKCSHCDYVETKTLDKLVKPQEQKVENAAATQEIQEQAVPTSNIQLSEGPQTGDSAPVRILFGLIGLCIVILLVVAYIKLK